MKVICSSEESLYRPEAVRWRQRMEMMKPLGDTVVLLPCSMKKPYSNSKSHQKFRKITRSFQELIVTSPFGICPRELENTFPLTVNCNEPQVFPASMGAKRSLGRFSES